MPAYPTLTRALRAVLVAGAALGTLSTCSGGPTEPPDPPPSLAPADTLTLDFAVSRTVDVQPIAGTGQQLVVKLEAPQPGDSLSAVLLNAGVRLDSTIIRAGAGISPNTRQSVWIPRASAGIPLVLELRWIRRTGSTTVSTYLLGPTFEPEHAAQVLTVGDTIVEYLDGDADRDLFRIDAPPSSRLTLWVQLDSATQPIRIQMVTDDVFYGTADRSSELTDSAASPLVIARELAAEGQIFLMVRSAPGTVGAPTQIEARYRLWSDAIVRTPETAVATLAAGDTIVERIDEFGDHDRFTIPEAAGQEFRVFLARDSLSASPVRARLLVNGESPIPITLGAGDSVLDIRRSVWIQKVDAAPAILEVLGDTGASADRRPVGYRVMYQRRARAPEIAPVNVGLTDSVFTETLSSCADADDFEVHGPPYTQITLGAVIHGAPGCRVRVRVMIGDGVLSEVDSLTLGTDPDAVRGDFLTIYETGVLRLRVEGIDAPGQPIGRVQNVGYTLDVYRKDSIPEIAPVELAVGDSMTTETIARCGDWDAFDIVGAPGSVVVVNAGFGRATTCGMLLGWENSQSGFFHFGANEDAMRFGHITIPASGRARLRVATERRGTRADRGAPYFLKASLINTAPEFASATLAQGDTAHDTFSRCGDIDRYKVPLEAGEGVWLRFDRGRRSACRVIVSLTYESYAQGGFEIYPGDSVRPFLQHLVPTSGLYDLTVTTIPSGHTDDRDLPYSVVVTGAKNEIAPSALALGDTSAVEPWHDYDLDLFVVPLEAGKDYVASTLGPVMFIMNHPDGSFGVSSEEYPRGFRYPFRATETRDHRFRMGLVGTNHPVPLNYRFTIHEFDPRPETLPDTLLPGDTTGVEFFGHPGDEDRFIGRLTPGRYFRLEAFLSAGTFGAIGTEITAAAGGPVLASSYGYGNWSTPRGSLPASGRILVPMRNFLNTTDSTVNPSYRLRLVEIDPAPESRAATLAPTDSITDEPLNDPYDLDEYSFTVTAAGTYAVRLQAAASCSGDEDHLRMIVMNGTNVVATIISRTDAATAGTVALASGTTYKLIVEASEPTVGNCVMRAYRARVALQP